MIEVKPENWRCPAMAYAMRRPRIRSAAFSPIIADGAWVLPLTRSGMIEGVGDAQPFDPPHSELRVDDRAIVGAHPTGSDRMIDRVGAASDQVA